MIARMRWKQSARQNFHSAQRDGSRYTIDRLGDSWMVSHLPTGNAEGGRVAVPWADDRRSLTAAQHSCDVHAVSRATA